MKNSEKEIEEKHCPKCGEGYKINKGERLPEDCPLDYWFGSDNVFHWQCFECGNEWEENVK